jgi:hypothetical protein
VDGYTFLITAVLLLSQYAAIHGALPFPQFLAFIAVGIAALIHSRRQCRRLAASQPNWPPATDSHHGGNAPQHGTQEVPPFARDNAPREIEADCRPVVTWPNNPVLTAPPPPPVQET